MPANKRKLKIACVGLDADNERPIISAVEMTSSRLGADFHWTPPAQADICIVNVAEVDPAGIDAVVIRYSARQNGRVVDLVRPVRVSQLIAALQQAVQAHEERLAAAAAAPKPRRYRGQIIEEPARSGARGEPEAGGPTAAGNGTGKTVIYRGVRVTR